MSFGLLGVILEVWPIEAGVQRPVEHKMQSTAKKRASGAARCQDHGNGYAFKTRASWSGDGSLPADARDHKQYGLIIQVVAHET